jgi:IS30 family transposase
MPRCSDRRDAVKQLADEGLSNRDIGDVIGVAESTIRNDRGAAQNYARASEKSNDFNAPSGGPAQNYADGQLLNRIAPSLRS